VQVEAFLRSTDIIDWQNPEVTCLARSLSEGAPCCLHGLNAVWLPDTGWYRVDPRGNRGNIDAQFTPPVERLAFGVALPGEADLPEVWPDPLSVVIEALRSNRTAEELWENLPGVELWTHRNAR